MSKIRQEARIAELALLGKVLAFPSDCIKKTVSELEPDYFINEDTRSLWSVIYEIAGEGHTIEHSIIRDRVINLPNAVKIFHCMVQSLGTADTPSNLDYYIQRIKSHKGKLRIKDTGEYLAKEIEYNDPVQVLSMAERKLREINIRGKHDPVGIADIAKQMWSIYDASPEDRSIGVPVPLSLSALNNKLDGGFFESKLYVLGGRPAMGKTALSLYISDCFCTHGKRVLYVSLEMSKVELFSRLIAQKSGVEATKFKKMTFAADDWSRMYAAISTVSDREKYKLSVMDESRLHLCELEHLISREHMRDPIGLVVIDYIQLLRPYKNQKYINRESVIADISVSCKSIAKEISGCVLGLAQLNRKIEERPKGDRIPRPSDLRESGQLEQDADVLLMIHRPYSIDDQADPEQYFISVAKHRDGDVGLTECRFIASKMQFKN